MSTTAADDPIAVLERELVAAAARMGAGAPGPSEVPTAAAAATPSLRHRLTLVAAIAAVVVPVVAVVGALALTRAGSTGSTAARTRAGGLTLISELAVLRRPQRPSDLTGQPGLEILHSPEFRYSGAPATIDRALARHVTVRLPGAGPAGVALTVYGRPAASRGLWLSISVAPASHSASPGYQAPESARDLARDGLFTALGRGLVVGVVPDRVAQVRATVAGGPSSTWRVHDNVVGIRLPQHRASTIEWLDARGTVIRRIPTITHGLPRTPSLASILGVLRRPRRPVDVLPRALRPLAGVGQPSTEATQGVPDLTQARWATTTSWGANVYLVPFSPRGFATGPRLGILSAHEGATGISVGNVLDGTAMITSIVAPATLRTIQVVPDGVAWVRFEIRAPQGYAGPRHPLVEVRHNVAALELPGAGAAAVTATTWFDARLRIIARHPASAGAPASTPPSGDDLTTFLGVLRRPQTPADRSLPPLTQRRGFDPGLGTPVRGEARLATTTPWGSRIYLVPFVPPTGTGQILDLFGPPDAATAAAGFSAAQIQTGRAVLSQRITGRRPGVRLITVVPDRVRSILVAVPQASAATGEAHGNVVALVLPPSTLRGRGQITWLDARGRSIGSFPWVAGSR